MLESMAIVWSCDTWHSPQFIQQCKGILSAAVRESPQGICSLVCETGHKNMGILQPHLALESTYWTKTRMVTLDHLLKNVGVNYHL